MMSARFSRRCVALIQAAVILGLVVQAYGENPGRVAVANRQRVETMMGIAQSDGMVSAEEWRSIIGTARSTFSEPEIKDLQARLSNSSYLLAMQQRAADAAVARLSSLMVEPPGEPSLVLRFVPLGKVLDKAAAAGRNVIGEFSNRKQSCDACSAVQNTTEYKVR